MGQRIYSPMECLHLDHKDQKVSERIRKVLFDAYSVEADLIGVADFPPLRRSVESICAAKSVFVGCVDAGEVVAVAEIESLHDDETMNIAGFAVHPGVFRQGIGSRLLSHVLGILGDTVVTVSTASENLPAIALYEKHGFRVSARWATQCRIAMVTLSRSQFSTGQ